MLNITAQVWSNSEALLFSRSFMLRSELIMHPGLYLYYLAISIQVPVILLLSCVRVCARVCMCAHLSACRCASGVFLNHSPSVSHGTWNSPFPLDRLAIEAQRSTCLFPPVLVLQMGARNSNSGLHVCIASTLRMEPSLA